MKKSIKSPLFQLGLIILLLIGGGATVAQTNERAIQLEKNKNERLAWWKEARFGLFIHWGLYSEMAGFWEDEPVPGIGEWIMRRGKIPASEYENVARQFNPVKFNAREIVRTAKEAGMKYIVITAKHHDGFAMFDSKVSDYNIIQHTPYKKDPLKELAEACKEEGMRLGFYYSQAQDWYHIGGAGNNWEPSHKCTNENFDHYLKEIAVPQVEELLSNYGDISLIWFDTPVKINKEQSTLLKELVLKKQPDCVTNGRIGNNMGDYLQTGDNQVPKKPKLIDWEVPVTMNNTWGYKQADRHWKSSETIIRQLVDVVSKNGNYLLNIGPKGDGSVPLASMDRLRDVGQWMKVYGDAIYGTSPSPYPFEHSWGRITAKKGTVYLLMHEMPKDSLFCLYGLKNRVKSARFIESGKSLRFNQDKNEDGDWLKINLATIDSDFPVFGIELDIEGEKPEVDPVNIQQNSGFVELEAGVASVSGDLKVDDYGAVDNWTEPKGKLSWKFKVTHPGKYVVQVVTVGKRFSGDPEWPVFWNDGHQVIVKTGHSEVKGRIKNDFEIPEATDEHFPMIISDLGKPIKFPHKGVYELSIEAEKIVPHKDAPKPVGLRFRKVRLVPYFANKWSGPENYAKWEDMHNSAPKQRAMEWFKEAKYGMFIHWGPYSKPGGIWKGKKIEEYYSGPKVAEWLMYTCQIPRSEYEELAAGFKPSKNYAEKIAKLAKDAGMKYIVITSKHHDGFAMYDSKCSNYDIVDHAAYGADALEELYNACQKHGIEFGVYYSHGADWYDAGDGDYWKVKEKNDKLGVRTRSMGINLFDPSPNTFNEYLQKKAYPQVEELVRKFPKLKLIWFDGTKYINEDQALDFYKRIYDINPEVLISRRVGYDFGDYLDAGDNEIPESSDEMTKHWETVGTANNSWGYKSYDNDWKSPKEMLHWLVDIASKGGNYMFNIGPDGKGYVPSTCVNNLKEMGNWLKKYGEAIYGTTNWVISHEGPSGAPVQGTAQRRARGALDKFSTEDFWFTAKGNKVYAIALEKPLSVIRIKSLKKANGIVESVKLIGSSKELKWKQTGDALEVEVGRRLKDDFGYVLEVKFGTTDLVKGSLGITNIE